MIIRDLRKRNLFITFTALLIILVLILTELSAAICAKTVKMTAIGECHSVRLAAGDSHDFLVIQGLHTRWIRLVRLVFRVLWQIPDVVQTELP